MMTLMPHYLLWIVVKNGVLMGVQVTKLLGLFLLYRYLLDPTMLCLRYLSVRVQNKDISI
jgi:hypothetical protein